MNRSEAAQARLEVIRAWRRLFLNDDGSQKPDARIVLHDLNGALHGARTTVTGTPIDPLRMAVNEGRRQALMMIERRLYDPIEGLIEATAEDME